MQARLQPLLPLELPNPADKWIEALLEALDDPNRHAGWLVQAEAAVKACPGNGGILTLAATSALLEGRPERALAFIEKFLKRYRPRRTEHLLLALALFQGKKRAAARTLLQEHGLTQWHDASQVFPAGQARFRWLAEQVNGIMGRGDPAIRRPRAPGETRAKPARSP